MCVDGRHTSCMTYFKYGVLRGSFGRVGAGVVMNNPTAAASFVVVLVVVGFFLLFSVLLY